MKGKTVFERMTNVSDKFLEEAAFAPTGGKGIAKTPRPQRERRLARFMSSGWGVASVCLITGVLAVAAMVMWGRMGASVAPPPIGSQLQTGTADTADTAVGTDEAVTPEPPPEFQPDVWNAPGTDPLPDRIAREIIRATLRDPELTDCTEADVSLRYFGEYSGAYVMFVDVAIFMYGEMVCEETLGNVTFWFSDIQPLMVYYEQAFYELKDAYKMGYLTDDDVHKLHEIYSNVGNVLKDLTFRVGYEEGTAVRLRGHSLSLLVAVREGEDMDGFVIRDGKLLMCTQAEFVLAEGEQAGYRIASRASYDQQADETVPAGYVRFDFDIPEDAPLGRYDLRLTAKYHSETREAGLTLMEAGEDYLLKTAESAIRENHSRGVDLTPYRAFIEEREEGGYAVVYRMYVQNIPTLTCYTAIISPEGRVGTGLTHAGDFEPYLDVATPELIADAMARLGVTDTEHLVMRIDTMDYLILCYEVHDESGSIVEYRAERVCAKPFPRG